MRARNRELFGLIPAALLMTAGLAAVLVQESNKLSNTSLVYGAIFLGLCIVGHIFIRVTLPHADPYIFPLVSVLACFGLVMVLRIYGVTYARQQAQWFVFGLVLLVITVLLFRDYRKLERYRYLVVVASIVLMILPRVPGIADPVNGAYLDINIGPIDFQPTEFGKIGLIIFLASYLRDHRQALAQGTRIFGIKVGLPPLKHLGPMLLLWGIAMLILVFLRDIGSSIMFFGGLLAVLYVATNRASFVVVGVVAFGLGAWYLGTHVPHVYSRVLEWEHPFRESLYNSSTSSSYQLANAQFEQAAGGLFGQGFGESILQIPGTHQNWLPAPGTDMIYAVIVSELGLFGGVGLLAVYMIICWRGFKAATLARDSFSKLLATGLSTILALQVFVIVGGVTRVIPLTGVTLPFVSYGGSSIMANFILIALLLLVSDRARRQAIGAMTN
jgi:cell division protein FtsW (lipid II flippase)